VTAPLDSQREADIAATNKVIMDWNNVGKAEFSDLVVYAASSNSTTIQTLAADLKSDANMTESELSSYSPVKYDVTVSTNFIQSQPFVFGEEVDVSFWFNKNTNQTADGRVTIKIFREFDDRESDSQTCANDRGDFTPPSTCTFRYRADKVCVKFSKASDNWSPDSAIGGDVGCEFYNGITAFGVNERFTAAHYVLTTDTMVNNFNSFQVTARSASDPFIKVQELTEGTGDFGPTAAERALTGLIIMIIGIFFMIPCCGFCFLLFFCMRRHSDRSWHRRHF
jgi:hypothetical protein